MKIKSFTRGRNDHNIPETDAAFDERVNAFADKVDVVKIDVAGPNHRVVTWEVRTNE